MNDFCPWSDEAAAFFDEAQKAHAELAEARNVHAEGVLLLHLCRAQVRPSNHLPRLLISQGRMTTLEVLAHAL